jgi:Xaa-Pro aminopeptidase
MKTTSARLLFATSERDANLLYVTRFFAPDPMIYVLHGEESCLILSDLEVDRGRREARVNQVVSQSELALEACGNTQLSQEKVLIFYLKKRGISHVEVPADFPLSVAEILRKARISVQCIPEPFWPEREVKSSEEIRYLRRALEMTQAAMERAFTVLRAAKIGKGGALRWGNAPLTSERLRMEIEHCIVAHGGVASNHSIIAGGQQAIDPHERGSGLLFAHQLIILDIFPRDATSGYFGDLTRTVVRGQATDAQRHLWETCLQGQKRALSAIRPEASGREIQNELKIFFAQKGYPTEQKTGRWSGFFHGAGHGLGLEIHEHPRFGAAHFRPQQVLTLEPGLYIPGLGGVRHEDVLQVTTTGKRLLTTLPKPLEL